MRHLLLLFPLLGLCGCGLNEFDVTQSAGSTVPGATPLNQVLNGVPQMNGFNKFDFSQSQEFKNQNAQKDHVRSAKLTRFTVTISGPASQDFGFLDSISFFAEANGQRTRVAHKEHIAQLGLKAPNPVLMLDLDDVELQPFVAASTLSFTTEASGRQPSQDTQLTGEAVLHLKVGL
jgi:hypothetical protein